MNLEISVNVSLSFGRFSLARPWGSPLGQAAAYSAGLASTLHERPLPSTPLRHRYLNGVLLKDAQLQEDVQLDLPLVEELFHLHLGIVQLLQDRLDVTDGATVGCLVVGHS